jgi:hypothetical protein
MNLIKLGALTSKLPNGVTRAIGTAGFLSRKHSPVVLLGAGVVGVIATVVMASKATLQVEQVLTENEKERIWRQAAIDAKDTANYNLDELQHDLSTLKLKTAGQIARLYAPAFAVGVISIVCLTGSHWIMTKRNFNLTAAYVGIEEAFKRYRKQVSDELGPEREKEFYYGVETRTVKETLADGTVVDKEVKILPKDAKSPYSFMFCEVNSDEWKPESILNRTFLNCQQDMVNDWLKSRGYVFLNEVLRALRMDPTPEGQIVGWVWDADQTGDGDGYIDFGIFYANNDHQIANWINGDASGVRLDFNVDGPIDKKFFKKLRK